MWKEKNKNNCFCKLHMALLNKSQKTFNPLYEEHLFQNLPLNLSKIFWTWTENYLILCFVFAVNRQAELNSHENKRFVQVSDRCFTECLVNSWLDSERSACRWKITWNSEFRSFQINSGWFIGNCSKFLTPFIGQWIYNRARFTIIWFSTNVPSTCMHVEKLNPN